MVAARATGSVSATDQEMIMRLITRERIDSGSESPDAQRLLALLSAATENTLMLDELRDRSVSAPAQAAYELQLDGYVIDRITLKGERAVGYRLRAHPPVSL
jgi:hypothetical protein